MHSLVRTPVLSHDVQNASLEVGEVGMATLGRSGITQTGTQRSPVTSVALNCSALSSRYSSLELGTLTRSMLVVVKAVIESPSVKS
jgi:hypothetical protein